MNHWADYAIFGLFILISIGIGIYHALTGGKQRTTEEFILADRKLKLIPTTLSLLMSYQSAILIIGATAEVYSFGIEMWMMSMVGFAVATLLSERLAVPWLYPLKLTSVNEYFEMRFGDRELRAFASVLGILSAIMYMGVAMFAPAVALETATGFPTVVSIPIMSVVCVVYTALGGMRAVVWTDVFQAVIMFGGILAVTIKGMLAVGIHRAFDSIEESSRDNLIHWSVDPRERQTLWAYALGWGLQWGCLFSIQQASVQRFSALPTLSKARLSVLLIFPGLVLLFVLVNMLAVAVFAHFTDKGCDPLVSGQIQHPNELLPLYVREIFVDIPGLAGLFLSTLFSGALSSVSSSLSGSAANAWDDIIRWRVPHLSENRAAMFNKLLVVIFGLLAMTMSFLAKFMAGPVTQVAVSFFGACAGPLLGIFFLCGARPLTWIRSRAIIIGGFVGLVLNLWISISAGFLENKYETKPPISTANCLSPYNVTNVSVSNITLTTELQGIDNLYGISYMWYAPFGAVCTVIIGMLLSVIINGATSTPKETIEDRLLIPFDGMFKCSFERDYQHVRRYAADEKSHGAMHRDVATEMDDVSGI